MLRDTPWGAVSAAKAALLSPAEDTLLPIERRRHRERVHVQFSINRVSGNLDDTRKAAMLPRTMNSLAQPSASLRALATYAAVALIVPGGSLIAFTLWASRHRGWLTARTWRALLGVIRSIGRSHRSHASQTNAHANQGCQAPLRSRD
jgi:hypothetical protein